MICKGTGYDGIYRLLSKTYNDGGVTPNAQYIYDKWNASDYTGDSRGQLIEVSNNLNFKRQFRDYDPLARPVNVQTWLPSNYGGAWYTINGIKYDLAGNMTEFLYPSGRKLVGTFDRANRITQMAFPNAWPASYNYASGITYAASGAPLSITLGNGIVETFTYNSNLQPLQMRAASGLSSLL